MKKSSFVFAALLTWGVSAMAQTMAFPEGAEPLTPDALTGRYAAADPASDADLAKAVAVASADVPTAAGPAPAAPAAPSN